MSTFHPVHMWQAMGPLNRFIALTLVLMAIATIAIAIERVLFLRAARIGDAAFVAKASPLLEAHDYVGVGNAARLHPRSIIGRLARTATTRFVATSRGANATELTRREVERELEAIGDDLRRGTAVIASVGSIAPFIGLLGTVVGIITAFQGIAASGSGGLGSVSAGIAEALVETALGLMVAIPAVLLHNALSTRINATEGRWTRIAAEIVDDLELPAVREALSEVKFEKAA
jgi:biopolymer transport protein ExbB